MNKCNNIEEYLNYIGQCRSDSFGQRFRQQFRDNRGSAELAMLAAPSEIEFQQLKRTVDIMTDLEKTNIEDLNDEQIKKIADSASADCGNVSIFFNGFILQRKKIKE